MLDDLGQFLELDKDKFIPGNVDHIMFLFFEKGHTFQEFCDLPIPYIISIVMTQQYINEQQNKR